MMGTTSPAGKVTNAELMRERIVAPAGPKLYKVDTGRIGNVQASLGGGRPLAD